MDIIIYKGLDPVIGAVGNGYLAADIIPFDVYPLANNISRTELSFFMPDDQKFLVIPIGGYGREVSIKISGKAGSEIRNSGPTS